MFRISVFEVRDIGFRNLVIRYSRKDVLKPFKEPVEPRYPKVRITKFVIRLQK